jgi:hypothetical protein
MKKTMIMVTLIAVAVIVLLLWPMSIRHPPPTPNLLAKLELRQIQMACRSYTVDNRASPSGSVSAVCQALTGKNSIPYIEFNSRRTTHDGSFLDPWGTPYHFSFFNPTNPVVSSAGKDRSWGTVDDIISE